MVKFGKIFRSIQTEEFEGRYLRYKSLKQFIKSKEQKLNDPNSNQNDSDEQSNSILQEFITQLNNELRFYSCYRKKEREIYEKVNEHLHIQGIYNQMTQKQIAREYKDLSDISISILNLTIFITNNIIAMRKILKKFDKKFGVDLTYNYITTKIDSKEGCDLLHIFAFRILDEAQVLLLSLEKNISDSLTNNKFRDDLFYDTSKGKNPELYNSLSGKSEETYVFDDNEIDDIIIKSKDIIIRAIEQTNKLIREFKLKFKHWNTYLKTFKNNNISINRVSKGISGESKMNFLSSGTTEQVPPLSSGGEFGISNKVVNIDLIGKENKNNIKLIYLHSFLSGIANYIILPDFINIIKNFGFIQSAKSHSKYWIIFVIPIYIMLPIAPLITLLASKKISYILNFKTIFIISCVLSGIGHLLYSFGYYFTWQHNNLLSIILMIIGRLALGGGINQWFGSNYIIEYVPRRVISNAMLKYKTLTLIGNALGPFICILIGFISKIGVNINDNIKYSIPTLLCGLLSFIELVLVVFKFTDPVKDNFEPFLGEIQDISWESKIKYKGKKYNSINQDIINRKEENRYLDAELVEGKISELVWKELNTHNILKKSFFLIKILVFVSSFLVVFYLLFIVLFFLIKPDIFGKSDYDFIYTGAFLCGTLIIEISLYYLYEKKIRKLIQDTILIIILLIIMAIMQIFTFLYPVFPKYLTFKNGNILHYIDVSFIIFICILAVLSHLMLTSTIHLFSKLVPYNEKFSNGEQIIYFLKLGEILGCVVIFLFHTVHEQSLLIIPIGIFILTIFYCRKKKLLNETSLTRVLKGNAIRKFKIGEF